MTAIAIQALAPYYNKEEKIKNAVDEGLEVLSKLQQNDGSFSSVSVKNCESTAQVLTALSIMKISVNDSRFVKNSNTVIDGLMQYYTQGGFCHLPEGEMNQMATEQAMYALTAYYRSISGMNGLYEMKDGMRRKEIKITAESKSQGETASCEQKRNTTQQETKKKNTKNNSTTSEKSTKNLSQNAETTAVSETVTEKTQETDIMSNENKNLYEKETETETNETYEGIVEKAEDTSYSNQKKSRIWTGIAVVTCVSIGVLGIAIYRVKFRKSRK